MPPPLPPANGGFLVSGRKIFASLSGAADIHNIVCVTNDSTIVREEVFGPVLAVLAFDDEDEVVKLANESDYGPAAGIWTSDIRRAHRVSRALKVGTVWINTYRNVSYMAPFGGFKQSGYGRDNGLEALDGFLQTKTVWVELTGATRDPFVIG